MTSFRVPIEVPQPSQLFLDASKLHDASGWFDFDSPEYAPLEVLSLDDEWALIDGHTRAYLAGSRGRNGGGRS